MGKNSPSTKQEERLAGQMEWQGQRYRELFGKEKPFHGVTTEVQGGESGTGWGGSQKVEGLPCHTESSQRETPGTLILGRGLRSPKF